MECDRLIPRRVQFEGEDFGLGLKVAEGGRQKARGDGGLKPAATQVREHSREGCATKRQEKEARRRRASQDE